MQHPYLNRLVAFFMATVLILMLLTSCITEDSSVASNGASEQLGQTLPSGFEHDEEAKNTLASLEQVTDDLYALNYTDDYALDDLLAQGVESEQALGAFASEQVLFGLPFNQTIPDIGVSCSSFFAHTPDGDVIQGRNLDIADAQNTLVYTQPPEGYSSISTASGHLLGYYDIIPATTEGQLALLAAPYYPIDGINEEGLSIAMLLVYGAPATHQETGKPAITSTVAIRMVLDKAATVDEAIALFEQFDMRGTANGNIHFHLVDETGKSALIEYVDDEMQVIYGEGPFQIVTNYFLSPGVVDEHMDGADRFEKLQVALKAANGVVTKDTAMELLESVKAVHDYDEMTGIDYNTTYSVVFDNTQRCLDICANMDYHKTYHFEVKSYPYG